MLLKLKKPKFFLNKLKFWEFQFSFAPLFLTH